MKTMKFCLLLLLLSCLIGCTRLNSDSSLNGDRFLDTKALSNSDTRLAEVATPKIIKELNRDLEPYVPEVEIVAPKPEQTFNRTDVKVRLKVENLPVFIDETLQLGNHLNLIVDNEPVRAIYSPEEPIIIENLLPGTHTLRVFAVRPWGESFKNEEAYAQTTFNVLTETNNNRIQPSEPLLTYNSPTGSYGAEPILLDFYLANAPLHAIAQNNSNLKDWRVRATINGTSFILEDWQPIYLTGLEPGENWVQLELIDQTGNDIENAFNNTVRVFTYNPQQNDTLAKLVSARLTLAQARSLVKPDNALLEATPEISTRDSAESDLQNNTEPEIIVDNLVEAVDEPEIVREATPTIDNEPSVSTLSEDEEDRIATAAKAALETSIIEQVKTKVTEQNSDIENITSTSSPVAIDDSVQPATSPGTTVIISEADSNREQPLTTIDIPQPESVEVSEGEVEIIVPKKPEPKANSSLWWKKILVGLRQKIEALAKALPNEV